MSLAVSSLARFGGTSGGGEERGRRKRPAAPPSPALSDARSTCHSASPSSPPPPKLPATQAPLPIKKRPHMARQPSAASAPQPSSGQGSPAPEQTTSRLLPPSGPVDFSLPNRSRAKVSPSKYSHTDTESPTSDHSLEVPSTSGAKPLDLSSTGPTSTTTFPAMPPLWNPLSFLGAPPMVPPGPLTNPLGAAGSSSGPPLGTGSAADPTGALAAMALASNPFLAAALASQPQLNPELLRLLLLASAGASPSLLPPAAASSSGGATSPSAHLSPGTSGASPGTEEASEGGAEGGEEGSFVINPATGNKVRRNYKNMTRERRMEANARERTRVHTIGAAFDALQKIVPSLAPEAKLSKLSVLRIGCKYILLLAAMAGKDYSEGGQAYSVPECLQMLHETILQEGKLKRNDRR